MKMLYFFPHPILGARMVRLHGRGMFVGGRGIRQEMMVPFAAKSGTTHYKRVFFLLRRMLDLFFLFLKTHLNRQKSRLGFLVRSTLELLGEVEMRDGIAFLALLLFGMMSILATSDTVGVEGILLLE